MSNELFRFLTKCTKRTYRRVREEGRARYTFVVDDNTLPGGHTVSTVVRWSGCRSRDPVLSWDYFVESRPASVGGSS